MPANKLPKHVAQNQDLQRKIDGNLNLRTSGTSDRNQIPRVFELNDHSREVTVVTEKITPASRFDLRVHHGDASLASEKNDDRARSGTIGPGRN